MNLDQLACPFACAAGTLLPVDSLGSRLAFDSLRVSSSGSMVAATARRPGAGCAVAPGGQKDARVFLYCSETNACSWYDFGADGRAPAVAAWDAMEPRLLAVVVEQVRWRGAGRRLKPMRSCMQAASDVQQCTSVCICAARCR